MQKTNANKFSNQLTSKTKSATPDKVFGGRKRTRRSRRSRPGGQNKLQASSPGFLTSAHVYNSQFSSSLSTAVPPPQPTQTFQEWLHEDRRTFREMYDKIDALVRSYEFPISKELEGLFKKMCLQYNIVPNPSQDPILDGIRNLLKLNPSTHSVTYACRGPMGTTYNGVWRFDNPHNYSLKTGVQVTRFNYDEDRPVIWCLDFSCISPFIAPIVIQAFTLTINEAPLELVVPCPFIEAKDICDYVPGDTIFDDLFMNFIEYYKMKSCKTYYSAEIFTDYILMVNIRGFNDFSIDNICSNMSHKIKDYQVYLVMRESSWLQLTFHNVLYLTASWVYHVLRVQRTQVQIAAIPDVQAEVRLDNYLQNYRSVSWPVICFVLFCLAVLGCLWYRYSGFTVLYYVIPIYMLMVLYFSFKIYYDCGVVASLSQCFGNHFTPASMLFNFVPPPAVHVEIEQVPINPEISFSLFCLIVTTIFEDAFLNFLGPSGRFFFGCVEFFFNWFLMKREVVQIVPAFFFHCLTYFVHPEACIFIHLFFNLMVYFLGVYRGPVISYANWFYSYYIQYAYGLVGNVTTSSRVSRWEPRFWAIPEIEADTPIPQHMGDLFPERVLIRCHDKPSDTRRVGYYSIVPTSVPGYVFSGSNHNRLISFVTRALRAPLITNSEVSLRAWNRPVFSAIIKFFSHNAPSFSYSEDALRAEFLSHFQGSKLRRIRRAFDQIALSPTTPSMDYVQSSAFFHKRDEMLVKMTDPPTAKPRVINNVDPRIQATLGPKILLLTKKMKSFTPYDSPLVFENSRYGKIYVHFYWGAGRTALQLSEWFNVAIHAEAGHFYVIVAGDDSLVIGRFFSDLIILEGDASAFDQTQSSGPLRYQILLMMALGFTFLEADILWATFHSTVKCYLSDGGKMSYSRKKLPSRNTGGPDTTWGNTMLMFSALTCVLNEMDPNVSVLEIEKIFASLGFEIKLRYDAYSWGEVMCGLPCSFLKGLFYPTVDGHFFWGPAPSRLLKLGKSFTNPLVLYKKWCARDPIRASELFMHDVVYGLSAFVLPNCLDLYVRQFLLTSSPILSFEEPYKTLAGSIRPALHPVYQYNVLCARYSCTVNDLLRLESLIQQLSVFTFLEDPLLITFSKMDY